METLIASFIWGTLGLAISVYGRKSQQFTPFLIGLLLMLLSYFLDAIWLSTAGVLLLLALWMSIRGYF